MSALANVKKALGIPGDEIAAIEARLREVESESGAVEAEKTAAEHELHECERRAEAKGADAAAARIEAAEKKLDRLRTRRGAVSSALAEAKAKKTADDKAARIEAGKAALVAAISRADEAQGAAVAALVTLSERFEKFGEAATAERLAHSALSRDAEAPHLAPRYPGRVEEEAARIVGTISTQEIRMPIR